MSKKFQYSKTSEINNIFLNAKIKHIIVDFIYDKLKPFGVYISKELKTKDDLALLKDKNFYIQNKFNGESSFLLFLSRCSVACFALSLWYIYIIANF